MAIIYFPKDDYHRIMRMGYFDWGGYLLSNDTNIYDCNDESVWDKKIVAICIVKCKPKYIQSLFATVNN